MNWTSFAFIAPALWAGCNYIDKYVITRYFKEGSTAVLQMIAGFFAGITAFIIFLTGIDLSVASELVRWVMIGNGVLFVISFVPYFYALREEDASIVIPIYQTIPVFSYVLGFVVLHETLRVTQIAAGLIIIVGAFGLSLDLSEKIRLKLRPLLWMLLSSLLMAFSALIFKVVAIDEGFWVTSFWEYLGSGLLTLVIFVTNASARRTFLSLFTKHRNILGMSGVQEAMNIGGNLMSSFALLVAPMALVSVVVNGLQPFYVLLFGVILTIFFPNHFNERIAKKDIVQKVVFVLVIFLGTFLLNGG